MWINYIFLIITCSLVIRIHGKNLDTSNDEPVSNPIKFPDNDDNSNNENLQSINPNQQAIIAIQIINSTAAEGESKPSGSNKKRTIEASLGYGGYQGNNFYYKTQDGKKQQQQQQTQNYYYPQQKQQYQPHYMTQYPSGNSGYQQSKQEHTTLFSTINQGQISGLSPNIPAQFVQYPVTPHGSTQQLQIPVIVLRVYSDQLSHSNEIYPNLPASNPYASLINMINLQQLLNGYMQENIAYSAPQSHQVPQIPQASQQYLASPQYEEQQQQQYELPIAENYPKSTHTQVVIKPKKQYYKSPKAMGVSVTTPTGFSYKALPSQNQQQHAQYVYTNEAATQQYLAGAQQYVAQGNQYSVPVVGAPNYYEHSQQAYESQATQNESPYTSPQIQQPVYETQQTAADYNDYIRQMAYSTDQASAGKPDEKDQTQYIYINEAELSNHGYVYKNPSTGEYMYYPSTMASQHGQMTADTKYSLPDPSSEHHHQSTPSISYSYTTPAASQGSHSRLAVTEKSVHKQYNYHAQNPRHAVQTSSEEHMSSSAGRAKKNKSSSMRPLVLAPHS
ncbi:probable serine/threonine-protein kinase mps1 isoform X2 [Chrysoperla carnea]|uniref:probable serine/threonine-protein kinase mps1 isoform X2 n=1 Tax=Chrysoperla carnea TaxID=189513 RepID=UPI001D05C4A8|nr:probable serine/threonine-protein kinase mps1 isoform X2 [Chrysoperla carnea]